MARLERRYHQRMSALTCARCGAPLPQEAANTSLTCAFCGTASAPPPRVVVHEVERVVERVVIRDSSGAPLGMPCPRCVQGMRDVEASGLKLSQCPRCGGAWVTADVTAAMRRTTNEDLREQVNRGEVFALAKPPRQPLACPVCKATMECVGMAQTVHEVDVCKAHGTWFDRTELNAFMAREKMRREGEE